MNPAASEQHSEPSLARVLGFGALVVYGVGDMLGSGIYALVGRAAGVMGNAMWLAFVVSMAAALLTGLTYAALGSRYPRAAGAAHVTQRAFGRAWLSYVVGLAVLASGLTSMATQTRAFSGYLHGLIPPVTPMVAMIGFVVVLTLVNWWGIRESARFNLMCTLVEAGGLLCVVAVGARHLGTVNYLDMPGGWDTTRVMSGAVLTFYAFIGFEDMINVSEEVQRPQQVFPRALVTALVIVTLIYLAVSLVVVSVVPATELAASSQPMVLVMQRAVPGFPAMIISGVALFAIANTALVNYIMGSRLMYGMAVQRLLPRWLAHVHPQRRTPARAIFSMMIMVLLLVAAGNLAELAAATSALLLMVFIVMHVALLILQRREPDPAGGWRLPEWIPVAGIIVCAGLLTQVRGRALLIALSLLGLIAILYTMMRPRGGSLPESAP